jgi:hypothetical protein
MTERTVGIMINSIYIIIFLVILVVVQFATIIFLVSYVVNYSRGIARKEKIDVSHSKVKKRMEESLEATQEKVLQDSLNLLKQGTAGDDIYSSQGIDDFVRDNPRIFGGKE